MGSLDGKVAVVTGATQGIGRAIADGLATAGARIVVADLRGAQEAAQAFDGGVGVTVDVSKEDDVQRLVDEAVAECGGIDILVNNAGLYASLDLNRGSPRVDPTQQDESGAAQSIHPNSE